MSKAASATFWHFAGSDGAGQATGEFVARAADLVDRLYFPLANEAGMRSWASPRLQGSPAASHNEYLGIPLTAEDLPHVLAHRGFWLTEAGRPPFALSSISPQGLAGKAKPSIIRAGPGWFEINRRDPAGRFVVKATLWCPTDLDEKVELMRVEVANLSRSRLSFKPYAALPVFARSAGDVRDHRHVTALLHRVGLHRRGLTVCPTMTFDERGHKLNRVRYSVLAWGPGNSVPAAIWPTQDSFLGEGGTYAAPAAVWQRQDGPKASPRQMQGREALAGFRFPDLSLAPGRSACFLLVSGISDDDTAVRRWERWGGRPKAASRSLAATAQHWAEQVARISFRMPDGDLNNWLAWVNFQPILRRLYGNSYLPQFDYGRGGKGWRDLWQDCLALLLSDPEPVRAMLLHNFGGVRIDGSNATIIGSGGRFIADRNNIPRTWMDHGIWPVYTALLYVDQTGDLGFLLKDREYFRDPQLHRCRKRDPRWTPAYGEQLRTRSGRVYRGTVLEHMLVQNLTAFFNVGEHNMCRLEGADWNDGLDMAPDRGESVAFSAFYAWNLERLAVAVEMLAARGHTELVVAEELKLLLDRVPGGRRVNYGSWRARQERLGQYLETVAKDVSGRAARVAAAELAGDLRAKSRDLFGRIGRQEWVKAGRELAFFNGYYDNRGCRVEGRHGRGVRMTLTGQVFPVMAGIATDRQVDEVVRSARRLLRDPVTGGVRLNTDFGGVQPELGRAFSFAYGEKENGAVFSHMAVMYAYALYLRRRAGEGRDVWQALFRAAVDQGRARIFPGIPEYFNAEGRGLYCYLTGSASWLVYLVLTQVFGVRGEVGDLVIDPQLLPDDFDGDGACSVNLHFAGRPLTVVIRNPGRLKPGRYAVGAVTMGGKPVPFEALPGGGARIARFVLRRFPEGRRVPVVVVLKPRRGRRGSSSGGAATPPRGDMEQ